MLSLSVYLSSEASFSCSISYSVYTEASYCLLETHMLMPSRYLTLLLPLLQTLEGEGWRFT